MSTPEDEALAAARKYLHGWSLRGWLDYDKLHDAMSGPLAALILEREAAAKQRGAEEERRDVVAWLREPMTISAMRNALWCSDAIQCGDHKRGGGG